MYELLISKFSDPGLRDKLIATGDAELIEGNNHWDRYWGVCRGEGQNKLWKLLIDKKMNRTDLKDASGISFNVLAKMGKNEAISMESLYKICAALDCGIGDIVEFINDEND